MRRMRYHSIGVEYVASEFIDNITGEGADDWI